MKRIMTGAAALIIMLCSLMPAFGASPKIKIDGYASDWKPGSYTVYEGSNPDMGNNFKHFTCSYIVNGEENSVYYLFVFSTDKRLGDPVLNKDEVEEKRSNIEVKFTASGCDTVVLTGTGLKDDDITVLSPSPDNEYYKLDAAMQLQNSGSVIVEIRLNYKGGLAVPVSCSVSASDENRSASNIQRINIYSLSDNTDEESNNSDKKTTAEKTTKEAATRKNSTKTTAKSGEDEHGHRVDYAADGATRKHTTDAYKELDKIIAGAGKTASENSKSGESKAKSTTKKSKTKSSGKKAADKSETAEAGEEIITSIVYVNQNTETASATQAEETAANGSAFGSKGIRSSTALKAAAGACALVLFGVIGVWAVKSREGESEEE
ncbi:MAG: hypothetical protein IKR90_07115 [Clostridia bacterium]|nr:hypothetical protein [Clostridia bacterium]